MGVMSVFMSAAPPALHWMLDGPLGISTSGSVELPNVAVFATAAAIILLIVFLLITLLRTRRAVHRASAAPSTSRAPQQAGSPSLSAGSRPIRRAGAQPKTVHIMPREVTLVVEHRPDLSPAQILRLTAEQVQALPKQDEQMLAARDVSAMMDTPSQGPAGDDDVADAILTGRVTRLRRGQERSVSLVAATLARPTPGSANADEQTGLLELVNGLGRRIAAGQGGPQSPDLTITAASPNWLASASPTHGGGGGVGGPGGVPVPPGRAPTGDAWHISLPATLNLSGQGEDVHVAILDTAPCDYDCERAYARWGTQALPEPTRQPHPLIASLLRPEGPLKVYYGGGLHLLQTVDYDLNEHHYPMPDHGLFVAGIVHSIAPRAKIHLIEALNPYGVGTLETFAQAYRVVQLLAEGKDPERMGDEGEGGVQALARTASGTLPIVLNCSWVFNVPRSRQELQEDEALTQQLTMAAQGFTDVWQALVGNEHVSIVAAAGNDRRLGDTTPPAERFPAAFPNIIGVAALGSGGQPAPYSDATEPTQPEDLATFGGDVLAAGGGDPGAETAWIADAEKGMLGIYVGTKFPDGTPNESGWARWAGTSFAAPIITGVLACAMSAQPTTNLALAQSQAMTTLQSACAPQPLLGRALNVQQG